MTANLLIAIIVATLGIPAGIILGNQTRREHAWGLRPFIILSILLSTGTISYVTLHSWPLIASIVTILSSTIALGIWWWFKAPPLQQKILVLLLIELVIMSVCSLIQASDQQVLHLILLWGIVAGTLLSIAQEKTAAVIRFAGIGMGALLIVGILHLLLYVPNI